MIAGDEAGFMVIGTVAHWPVVPWALPRSLHCFGICTCLPCSHPRDGVAWAYGSNRSVFWQELSNDLGDDLANWICAWCDLQPDPLGAVRVIESMMELHATLRQIWEWIASHAPWVTLEDTWVQPAKNGDVNISWDNSTARIFKL